MDDAKPRKAMLILISSALLLVVGGAFYNALSHKGGQDTHAIRAVAEAFVRQQVSGAGAPHFSSAAETSVEKLPGEKYLITGWVEVVTPNGGMTHNSYNCTILMNSDGDWVAEQVNVLPTL
jgi:hypothetical protein